MKKLILILPVLVLALFGAFDAGAQTPTKAVITPLGPPTFVASNMTTNVTTSPFLLFRERPVSFATVGRSVTNEATRITGFLEFSTNRPGETSTNWFRPIPPVSIVLATNHSGITTQQLGSVVAASSLLDGFVQARFWSFVNSSTTNGWTNSALSSVIVP